MNQSKDNLSENTNMENPNIDIEAENKHKEENKRDSGIERKNNKETEKVVRETADGSLEVDWDTIEEKYQEHARRRRHHRHRETTKNNEVLESSGTKKKKHKKLKVFLIVILCVVLAIISTLAALYFIGRNQLLNYDTAKITPPDFAEYEDDGKTVYYNGHKYTFNEHITSILFMGIDNRKLKENAVAGTAGQADALYLFTYDLTAGKIRVLSLNRDTMADISRYDDKGNFYDTSNSQLCLAYAYGDGKKVSAKNQVSAVQRLIYNIPINGYYAIDLSAIKTLNDDIGGVTLTPEYTFKSFTKGVQVTLKGDKAEEFVRTRDTSLLDDNLRRIECQKMYINSFAGQIVPAIKNDLGIINKLYRHSSENTVTNVNIATMFYLASSLTTNYSGLGMTSFAGEYKVVKGDEFPEYQLDKKKAFETVLDIFYIKEK